MKKSAKSVRILQDEEYEQRHPNTSQSILKCDGNAAGYSKSKSKKRLFASYNADEVSSGGAKHSQPNAKKSAGVGCSPLRSERFTATDKNARSNKEEAFSPSRISSDARDFNFNSDSISSSGSKNSNHPSTSYLNNNPNPPNRSKLKLNRHATVSSCQASHKATIKSGDNISSLQFNVTGASGGRINGQEFVENSQSTIGRHPVYTVRDPAVSDQLQFIDDSLNSLLSTGSNSNAPQNKLMSESAVNNPSEIVNPLNISIIANNSDIAQYPHQTFAVKRNWDSNSKLIYQCNCFYHQCLRVRRCLSMNALNLNMVDMAAKDSHPSQQSLPKTPVILETKVEDDDTDDKSPLLTKHNRGKREPTFKSLLRNHQDDFDILKATDQWSSLEDEETQTVDNDQRPHTITLEPSALNSPNFLQVMNSQAMMRQRRHSDTAMNPNLMMDTARGGSQGQIEPYSPNHKYCHCDQTLQDMSRHRSCCYHFHQHHQCHLREHQCPQSTIPQRDNKLLRGFQDIGIDYLKMHGGFKFLGGGFNQLKRVDVSSSVGQPRKQSDGDKEVNFDISAKSTDNDEDNLYSPISHSYNNDLEDVEIRPKNHRLGIRDSVSGRGNGPLKQTRNIGWRLRARRILNEKRKRIADYALAFALFGLVTMILETELSMGRVYSKSSIYSYLMKSLISGSTFVLVGLILAFHMYEIQLFSVNNCIGDWRIAMNYSRILRCSLEVIVCMFHPIPYNITFIWSLTMDGKSSNKDVSIDLILSLPMFLRLYLIFRVMLLHSRMFTDASSRSIGALNRVRFNIRFVLKTLMTICPGTILIVFILSLWLILSWIMRACERIHDEEHNNILNTMYLVAITFFSIGYGDMVPHTYCGRGISVLTGVMGSSCTALVVAVFARKLELKRSEKHVHNFMTDNRITKNLRNAAANVLRETWLFYKYTKLVKRVNAGKVRSHQRKFLRAIHNLRAAKESQRKLKDESNTLVDLAKTQSNIYDTVTLIRGDQDFLQHRVEAIEDNIKALTDQLVQLPGMLRDVIDRKEKT